MKFIVKLNQLNPVETGDDFLKLRVYNLVNEDWFEVEQEVSSSNIMDRMLEVAQNTIVKHRPENNYLFVTVESPGLLLTLGEGETASSETIISPKPTTLKAVRLYKLDQEGRPVLVHEYKPPGEVFVYDGFVSIPATMSYDFIVVETSEDWRPMFPNEIVLPPVKESVKTRRKRKSSTRMRKSKALSGVKKRRKKKSRRRKTRKR
ncbi:hypothetical protein IMZ38_03275 [Thermosphaera chiliense]|uniref:Uncharacterized protein n=1 Tax=Thermosphaera chiliense TaxID=3402707 RepID=A0A7M1URN9_9CREN|nr:hypothetical protein [Thermosphaera aggregans]QOR94940.1 hypothetical protein IMZ38_03275 [Thermosphaera aggregans]